MRTRILAAIVAVVLMLCYLSPVVLKLKDASLAAVMLIGVTMMLVDLWQSLQTPDN